jgi:mannitol/fructose-specific phosphotransferase system IIA component (Ntr-type)
MSTNTMILGCPNCRRRLPVPTDQGQSVVTCPSCGTQWDWCPAQEERAGARDADVPTLGTPPQVDRTGLDPGTEEAPARLWDSIVHEAIIADLRADTKEGAIREVIQRLVDVGRLPASEQEGMVRSLLDREEFGTTAIGMGVAVPHTRYYSKIERGLVVVARSRQGIEFGAFDDEPVQLLFLAICAPPNSHSLMYLLGDFFRDNQPFDELTGAPTQERFLELLQRAARGTPERTDGPH